MSHNVFGNVSADQQSRLSRWRSRHTPVHVRSRADPGMVLIVPRKCVVRLPCSRAAATSTDLYICDAFAQHGACARGDACPDVHADVAHAVRLYPHRRDSIVAADAAELPVLGATGQMLHVALPNEKVPSVFVDAGACLATQALNGDPDGLRSVCAHFAKKGVCDFGASCRFVHPLPPPAQQLQAREYHHGSQSPPGLAAAAADSASTLAVAGAVATGASLLGRRASASVSTNFSPPILFEAAGATAPEPPAPNTPHRPRRRYQFDPYGQRGWRAE
uniref:C3H1-type domain-containing protein n=1 Tax=Neobodo designis TaxID=312471 RepID=A0A7S1W0X7_NEODS